MLLYFTLHLLLSLFIHILPSSLLNYHTLIYFSKNKYVLPYFLPLPIIQIILVNYTTLVYSPVSSTISRTLIITLLYHIFIFLLILFYTTLPSTSLCSFIHFLPPSLLHSHISIYFGKVHFSYLNSIYY